MTASGARARQRAGRDQRGGSTGRTLAAAGVYARSVSFRPASWGLHRPLFFILANQRSAVRAIWKARKRPLPRSGPTPLAAGGPALADGRNGGFGQSTCQSGYRRLQRSGPFAHCGKLARSTVRSPRVGFLDLSLVTDSATRAFRFCSKVRVIQPSDRPATTAFAPHWKSACLLNESWSFE